MGDETLERVSQAFRTKGTRINTAQSQRIHDLHSVTLAEACRAVGGTFAQLLSVDEKAGEVRCVATSADMGERQAHLSNRQHRLDNSGLIARVVATKACCASEDS